MISIQRDCPLPSILISHLINLKNKQQDLLAQKFAGSLLYIVVIPLVSTKIAIDENSNYHGPLLMQFFSN